MTAKAYGLKKSHQKSSKVILGRHRASSITWMI